MDTPQIITITIGCVTFLVAFLFYFKSNNFAGTSTITVAFLLSLIGSVGPSTIKDMMFKQSEAGIEFSFRRNIDTPKKIQSAIEVGAEIDQGISSVRGVKLLQETMNTLDAKRSAADYLVLATNSWKAANYIEGIAFAQQGIRLNSKNVRLKATLLYRMGALLKDMGNSVKAEEFYNKSIDLDSNFSWPHIGLGNMLRNFKRYDEAEASFRKALERDPKDVYAPYGLGNVLLDLKRYDEAEASYRKALEFDPKYSNAHNGLGNVFFDLKRYDEAEASYRKALELDPSDSIVQNNLKILIDQQ